MPGTLQLHADPVAKLGKFPTKTAMNLNSSNWPVFPCSYQDGWWMLIERLPNHLVFINPTCNATRQKFERKHVNIVHCVHYVDNLKIAKSSHSSCPSYDIQSSFSSPQLPPHDFPITLQSGLKATCLPSVAIFLAAFLP